MKYINKNIQKLDSQIKDMFDLNMPNSAFSRVVPANMMKNLRNQYVEYVQNKKASYETQSTQVIKVNIAPLREAGYCCCPKELAAACELLLVQQNQASMSESTSDMNVLPENRDFAKTETVCNELADADDTTLSRSSDICFEQCEADKQVAAYKQKVYPGKLDREISKRKYSDKGAHQTRTKRKYFTKYMSDKFSKDTHPVSMNDMDNKTQQLFKEQEFNELVSEITGIN